MVYGIVTAATIIKAVRTETFILWHRIRYIVIFNIFNHLEGISNVALLVPPKVPK